jgi:plastocyanin
MARRQATHESPGGMRLGLAAGAVFACLALGMRAATASSAAAPEIEIRNFRFEPPVLEVAAGTTVTWINHDEEVHAVTSAQVPFASPGIDGDERFSFRFEKPGTYEYRCALHAQMTGTIVVR